MAGRGHFRGGAPCKRGNGPTYPGSVFLGGDAVYHPALVAMLAFPAFVLPSSATGRSHVGNLRFDLEEFLELFINLIPWLPSERGRTNVQ